MACGADRPAHEADSGPPVSRNSGVPLPHKADILFLIDNSPSMSPKQQALALQFKRFAAVLDTAGIDYHLGIVTSNCGAVPPSGLLSGPLGGSCDSLVGDNGTLQATPCSERPPTDYSGLAVQNVCNSICPSPIAPMAQAMPDGDPATANFIAVTGGSRPATNVPLDKVPDAFACMAYVGDQGCGIEMQLEGIKRAVDGMTNPVANEGFVRPDALLALILLTDEDDCSTLGSDRLEDDPRTMDCSPGGSMSPNWACFNPDYRCFAMGTLCDQPLDQPGLKTGCVERPGGGGMVNGLVNYTSFFDAIKPTAGWLLVDALDSPPVPPIGSGTVDIDHEDGTGTPGLNRSKSTPACLGPNDPITGLPIVGQPQTRLHDFIAHYAGHEYSVCAASDYGAALTAIATQISEAVAR